MNLREKAVLEELQRMQSSSFRSRSISAPKKLDKKVSHSRTVFAYGLAAATVAALMVTAVNISDSGPSTSAACSTLTPPENELPVGFAERLQTNLHTDEGYAGVSVSGRTVTLYWSGQRPHCAKPAEDALVRLRVRTVRYTLSSLRSTSDAVGKARTELGKDGLRLATWGPDIELNRVVVHLEPGHAPSSAEAELQREFGESVIVGRDEQPSAS